MHSGGQMRINWRPSSRLVDFGEIPETCSPTGNETERPSRSAKDRSSQSSDFLGQLQGATRSWRASRNLLFCAAHRAVPSVHDEKCRADSRRGAMGGIAKIRDLVAHPRRELEFAPVAQLAVEFAREHVEHVAAVAPMVGEIARRI